MSFTESNTVEAYLRDLLAGPIEGVPTYSVQESPALCTLFLVKET